MDLIDLEPYTVEVLQPESEVSSRGKVVRGNFEFIQLELNLFPQQITKLFDDYSEAA
jgi:hypothetical protein